SMSSSSVRRLQFAPCSVRPAQFPIVLAYSTDPVGNGFVASLARPGGNITGLSGSSDDTSPKQLELVATVVPNASRIGLLGNPTTTTYTDVRKGAQNAALKGRPNCSTGRSARSAGDRERIRCISQGTRAGFHRSRRCTFLWAATANRGIGAEKPSTVDIRAARVRGGGRADELWREPLGLLSSRRFVRRQDFQRCETRRLADRTADEIQSSNQSQDRRRSWRDDLAAALHLRRRGDRM